MANIQIKGLYEQKKREFSCQGAGLQRFDSDFIDAVNRSIRAINRKADLATPVVTIATTEGTILLDAAYEDVLSALVTRRLMDCGQRPQKPDDYQYVRLLNEESDLIDSIRQSLLNAEQDSDTDAGVIGLGLTHDD